MVGSKQSRIRASRLLLENPYAHLEHFLDQPPVGEPTTDAIRDSRLKLQNQYAHLDGNDGFSAIPAKAPDRNGTWSFEDIERLAREMQKKLWHARVQLWGSDVPDSPVTMLDPAKLCELFSYEFEVVDSLGVYTDRRERVVVAGQIDRRQRLIRISREFDPEVQLFTAAHEVGHLVLHPHVELLHRDRGTNGIGLNRDRIELEADKFSVYFLLPGALVRKEFESRFLVSKFILNEEAIFALRSGSRNGTGRSIEAGRRLSRELASAVSYNGRNFHSLANHFGVTTETMAIRLEELQII